MKKWKNLSIRELSYILNKDFKGLTKKAKRQHWPYKESKSPGKPIHIYSLDLLPDEIQTAWARWDKGAYDHYINKVMKEGGNPDHLPLPLSESQARDMLRWKVREDFFVKKNKTPGQKRPSWVYNGSSKGICPKARQIILDRFGIERMIPNPEESEDLRSQVVTQNHDTGTARFFEDFNDLIRSRKEKKTAAKRLGHVYEMVSLISDVPDKTNLTVIRVFGDSMNPLIQKGDLIIASPYKEPIIEGELYIIRLGMEIIVKKIQRVPGEGFRLLSLNPEYQSITIDPDNNKDFEIIGQVIVKVTAL